jgi:hypothetical protein
MYMICLPLECGKPLMADVLPASGVWHAPHGATGKSEVKSRRNKWTGNNYPVVEKPKTKMIELLWVSKNQVTPEMSRSSGSLRRLA